MSVCFYILMFQGYSIVCLFVCFCFFTFNFVGPISFNIPGVGGGGAGGWGHSHTNLLPHPCRVHQPLK